jgi:hypothetical protein
VPSGAYFKANYPPLPDVIVLRIDWIILTITIGSVRSSHISINLNTLHLDPTNFDPCKQLIQTLTLFYLIPNNYLNV